MWSGKAKIKKKAKDVKFKIQPKNVRTYVHVLVQRPSACYLYV